MNLICMRSASQFMVDAGSLRLPDGIDAFFEPEFGQNADTTRIWHRAFLDKFFSGSAEGERSYPLVVFDKWNWKEPFRLPYPAPPPFPASPPPAQPAPRPPPPQWIAVFKAGTGPCLANAGDICGGANMPSGHPGCCREGHYCEGGFWYKECKECAYAGCV